MVPSRTAREFGRKAGRMHATWNSQGVQPGPGEGEWGAVAAAGRGAVTAAVVH